MDFFSEACHKGQKLTEKANDEKFKILFDNAPDAIYLIDDNGTIVDGNKAAEKICGYSKEELIGKKFYDSNILAKNQIPKALKIFAKNKLGLPTGPDELILINKSGSPNPIEIRTYPVTIEDERLTLGIARDISERKKAEEEIINTIKCLPGHVFRVKKDEHGNFIFLLSEGNIATQFDITTKKIKGLKLQDISSPEDFSIIKKYYEKAFCNQNVSFEIKLKDKYWFQTNLLPYSIDENKHVHDIIGYSIDITKRKNAEEKMQESEERLNLAMSIANDGIWDWNLMTNEVFFDSRYYTMAGYDPKEFPHRLEEFQKRVHQDHIDEVMDQAKKHLNGEIERFQVEFLFKRKDGDWMWIQGTGKIVEHDETGTPVRFIGTHSDITERKKAEEKAKKAKQDRELLFKASSNGIRIITKDFRVKMMNHTMAEIAHTTIEEGVGMNCSEMFGSNWCGTEKCSMKRVLKNGNGFIEEDMRVTKQGKKIYFIDSVTPYKDDQGRIIGIIEDFRDISPIKEAEYDLEKAHEELKVLNKELEQKVHDRTDQIQRLLLQKDQFINQLGHDLKNPLGPFIQLLPILEKNSNSDQDKHIIYVLQRNARYMQNLVKKTIELAKLNSENTHFTFEPVQLNKILTDVISTNHTMFMDNNITIDNQVQPSIVVTVDLLHLQEVFTNLFNNVVKYTDGPGKVTITAEEKNDEIVVAVKDTGIGIAEDQIDHLFNEYYKVDSSRHDIDSSGLGLPICKRIIEKHGGTIWVESEGIGKGSTFYFSIPDNNPNLTEKNIENHYGAKNS